MGFYIFITYFYLSETQVKFILLRRAIILDLFSILTLLGGVGLFLFGMNLMGASLKNLAGGSLEKVLEKLTTGKISLRELSRVLHSVQP